MAAAGGGFEEPPAEVLTEAASAFGPLASPARLHVVWAPARGEGDVTGLVRSRTADTPARRLRGLRARSPPAVFESPQAGSRCRAGRRGRTQEGPEEREDPVMFRNGLEPWHLLVVAIVVIVLFGSRKLPDTARALGRSMRILKSEAKAMKDEDAARSTPPEPTRVHPAAEPVPPAPAPAPAPTPTRPRPPTTGH